MNDKATVNKVVGLHYQPAAGLPQIVVKGCGDMAEQILQQRDWLAGPPVIRDPKLAEQLYRLPMDGQIGPELFQLVATLLAHVFAIDEKLRGTEP
jgi:flagellar biosynthesis protein